MEHQCSTKIPTPPSSNTKVPTPPSTRPSSLRRPRSRYVNRLLKETSDTNATRFSQVSTYEMPEADHELTRYSILPAISSSTDVKESSNFPNNGEDERTLYIKSSRTCDNEEIQGKVTGSDDVNIYPPNVYHHRYCFPSVHDLLPLSEHQNKLPKKGGKNFDLSLANEKSRKEASTVLYNMDSSNVIDVRARNEKEKIQFSLSSDDMPQGKLDSREKPTVERSIGKHDLLIATRLPDGSRYEGTFANTDTLMDLLHFLQANSSCIQSSRCEFVTSDIPCRVFSDLHLSFQDAKIKTRTLLHIREFDNNL